MKNFKNVFALIMAVVILLSAVSVGAFDDVSEEHKYSKAISSLVSFKLLAGYEDSLFRPDNTITRAEFAAVMTRALNMESFVGGLDAGSVFSDMLNEDGSNHWGSGYVRFAYDQGIIAGMGDGTFAPDSPVTFEQAIKMVVCTLGYGDSAIENGGWPGGYLKVANDIGLMKNASLSPTDSPASRGIVAQIVYNALEIELIEKSNSGQSVTTKKTLLNDKLRVVRFKNYMITNVDGETTINSENNDVKKGEILLQRGTENLVISYGNVMSSATLKSYIGYYISGYYRINEEKEVLELVSVEMSSTKNMELNINFENIETYDDFKLEYWINKETDHSTKHAQISENAQLIYNGMVYDYKSSGDADERNLSRWLNPESEDFIYGSIRLLDSDGDASYDAVFVEDFEVYVVKNVPVTNDSISSNNYIIYDYYNSGKSIRLDPNDEDTTITIKNAKTGASVKTESLKAMNVLSVASSLDGSVYNCYVSSSNTVAGQITSLSEGRHIYTIARKDYELTKEFKQVVDSGKATLEVGSVGMYYLDHLGRIAAVKITAEQTGNYGYITIGGLTGSSGDVATVKLVALSGSPSVPTKTKLAEKVKINGKNYTDASAALSALEGSASLITANKSDSVSNADCSQLVRFIKNSSGQISNITTVKADKDGDVEIGTNTDSGAVVMGVPVKKLLYNGSGNFGNEIFASSSTKIIIVPTDRNKDSEYKRYTGYSNLKKGSEYEVEAYDINASGTASVLVVYGADTSSPVTSDTKVSIVKDKAIAINSLTEEICYTISVYEEGILNSYETEDNSSKFENIEAGDIVRFGFNGDGHINDVKFEVDHNEIVYESKHDEALYNGDYKFKTIMGTVASKSDEIILIAPAEVIYTEEATNEEGEVVTPASYSLDDSAKEGYAKTPSTNVYRVIKKSSSTVVETTMWESIVSYADVENNTASIAFAHAYANDLKLIVIYVTESK